jgi:hypothetical protein
MMEEEIGVTHLQAKEYQDCWTPAEKEKHEMNFLSRKGEA